MQQFEITCKNDKIKFYKLIALLLVLLNVAVFIFRLIAGINFYGSAGALLLSGLYLIYLLYSAKKKHQAFFIEVITFFILAGSWMALQNYLIALICVILGMLYHLSMQKLLFLFTADFVTKTNFPQKEYSWATFTNVLLRDNILTMDFKNNKLIQLEIEDNIDEIRFNEFAQQQINEATVLSEKQTGMTSY